MEIAKLGEFGLIDRLTKDIEIKNESTRYGVGDDCAVLSYPDKEVLVTTDLLMEGVHFDLTYIDLKHLGYKSAMVNISDVFAMNGTPRQLTVSLAIKPTSSIRIARRSIDVHGQPVTLATEGRHDPCVGIRAAPIVEAMLALTLIDHALRHRAQCGDVTPPTPIVPARRPD